MYLPTSLSLSLLLFICFYVNLSLNPSIHLPFFIYPTKLTFPSKNKDKTTFHQDLIKKRTFPSSIPLPSLCYTSITLSMYHEPHLYLLADADLLIAWNLFLWDLEIYISKTNVFLSNGCAYDSLQPTVLAFTWPFSSYRKIYLSLIFFFL